jgi:hypothetical protein
MWIRWIRIRIRNTGLRCKMSDHFPVLLLLMSIHPLPLYILFAIPALVHCRSGLCGGHHQPARESLSYRGREAVQQGDHPLLDHLEGHTHRHLLAVVRL